MTSRYFVYWLQGFIEISDPKTIGEKETEMIKKHLDLVFKNETVCKTQFDFEEVKRVINDGGSYENPKDGGLTPLNRSNPRNRDSHSELLC